MTEIKLRCHQANRADSGTKEDGTAIAVQTVQLNGSGPNGQPLEGQDPDVSNVSMSFTLRGDRVDDIKYNDIVTVQLGTGSTKAAPEKA